MPSFAALLFRAVLISIAYLPLALLLAFIGAVGNVALIFILVRVDSINVWVSSLLIPLGLVLSHAFFVGILATFLTLPETSLQLRCRASLWLGARAAPCLTLLVLPAGLFVFTGPLLVLLLIALLWSLATFFALPIHFIRFGWSGWLRRPDGFVVPPIRRMLLLLPVALLLAMLILMFLITMVDYASGLPHLILLTVLFCASYACAVLSAIFVGTLRVIETRKPG